MLIDRYLLRQLVMPLLIGLAVFIVILMSEVALRLGEALLGARVPAAMLLKYFWYNLPHVISWSLPVGVLTGVAMVSAAISRNGEATAARAGGMSLRRIWRSFAAVGVIASLAAFSLEEYVVPDANQRAVETLRALTHRQPVLKARDQQAFRDQAGRIIYVEHMDARSNRLEGVMILAEDDRAQLRQVTVAKWAELQNDRWVLREAVTVDFDEFGQPTGAPKRFASLPTTLWKALQDYYLDQRSEFEMTTREMRQAALALEAGGLDAQRMRVRLQFKYSMPVACLVFALVAAPLGARYARLGSFAGIVVSILIVFLYNGVRSWGLAFGLVGELDPIAAAWAQNVIFGALGLWLFLTAD